MGTELYLTDFLPKYPSIDSDLPENLDPYDENFYVALNNKKEFFDLKLERGESRPQVQGDLYKHQQIISRFFSSYTIYDSLLLFHYMGTGKTCSAFGATEKIRSEDDLRISRGEKPIYKGVIVLARGKGLINNLIYELVFKCSVKGKYLPENYETLTEREKAGRIKKKIQDYYKFYTFYTFAKQLFKLGDSEIKKRYSNFLVIIDEVHNIRRAEEKDENVQVTYDQIHRFLHQIASTKILLLSGTPMRDEPNEIAMVMNLILPQNQQLPVDKEFSAEFLKEQSMNEKTYLLVRNKKIEVLKQYFKGRISYLSSLSSLPKEYMGSYSINDIPTFTLDLDIMNEFQSTYYSQAFKKDKTQKGIYSNSRQASLMVFPSGIYGEAGFKTLKKQKTRYLLSTELINYINQGANGNFDIKLQNLQRLSSKYAKTIGQILEAEGRSGFIYCNLVEGSGAILFSLLLQEFGFLPANGMEKTPGKRYGILTHSTTSTIKMGKLISRFNEPDNFRGEFIKVMIGSRVAGEGLSLSNVQDIHILTPFWNYAEISQAIARGIREGSHEALIRNGIQPQIRIYQHTSIPQVKLKSGEMREKPEISIDLEMYKISAAKDISIKSIERVMKEAAFDCGLTYNINYKPENMDYSRECDYQSCQYICDGMEDYEQIPDLSTYQLYYSDKVVQKLQDSFKKLFQRNFSLSDMDPEYIRERAGEFNYFELLTALRNLINYNASLKNKYGFSSYLKENYNQYFLVNSLSSLPEKFSEYYTRRPYIRDSIQFSKLLEQIQTKYLPLIVETLPDYVDNDEKFRELINRLPLEIKETLIEGSILAREKGINKSVAFRNKVLDHFSHYIQKVGDTYTSSLLFDDYNILRCLEGETWSNCSETIEEKWSEKKEEIKSELESNPYGYYGIYDPETDKFWIRDITEEGKIESEDRRSKTTGSECSSTGWSREKLLRLVLNIKLDYPSDFCSGLSKEKIYEKAMKNTWAKRIVTLDMDSEDLCRVLYYAPYKKGDLCPILREWFADKDLLIVGKKEEKK